MIFLSTANLDSVFGNNDLVCNSIVICSNAFILGIGLSLYIHALLNFLECICWTNITCYIRVLATDKGNI